MVRGSSNAAEAIKGHRWPVRWAGLGAGLAMMIVISCSGPAPEPEPAAPVKPAVEQPVVWDHGGVRETGEDLRSLFEERREVMDPAARETVDENLSLIDRSIGELVTAVESDPENTRLHGLLLRAYRSQVRLLQRAVRLTKGGGTTPSAASSTTPES